MDYLKVHGHQKLSGNVEISGAKNASLPLIALTLLAQNDVTLHNAPDVIDIKTLLKLLDNLGATTAFDNNTITVNTSGVNSTRAVYDIVRKMRASILVLGPLLSRFGHCEVSLPGGCAIGQRPIDLHLKALEQMGADIAIEGGYVVARAPDGLKGAHIVFDKITVTGTSNIVMAAALAKGKTTISNAAREPEVVQVCEVLKNNGVSIEGIGTSELVIYGTDRRLISLDTIDIIPDRIEAGTYLCAAAITNSSITIHKCNSEHLSAIIAKLEEMGFSFDVTRDSVTIHPAKTIKPVDIVTQEYPAFPTDMQAQFLALSTQANGASTIEEKLFENRFMHVSELQRLGADIKLKGNVAAVKGPSKLIGADVMATDLRASSALVLAGLIAEEDTTIHRIYHLDRGYENLEQKLQQLGANISRGQE